MNKVKESLKIKGSMTLKLIKANGDIEVRRKDNLILDVGFDFIADAIGKASNRPGVMSHIAIGEGSTEVNAAQTALVDELTRKAATYTHTAGSKEFMLSSTFEPGEGTGAITEAGVVNAASGGTLLDRVTFLVVNKGADDTITINFQFTLSQDENNQA